MQKRQPDPMRLAMLTIAGACLASATWFTFLLPIPQLALHGSGFLAVLWADRFRLLVYALPLASGISLWFWAERRFKKAFLDDVWTEAQLAPVQGLLARKAWGWAGLGLIAVAAVTLLQRRHSNAEALLYMLILPSQTAQRLRVLITPKVQKTSVLADWRNFQPIRSEHWGDRRA